MDESCGFQHILLMNHLGIMLKCLVGRFRRPVMGLVLWMCQALSEVHAVCLWGTDSEARN